MTKPSLQRARDQLAGAKTEPDLATEEEVASWPPPATPEPPDSGGTRPPIRQRPWVARATLPPIGPVTVVWIVLVAVVANFALRLPAASLATSLTFLGLLALLALSGRLRSTTSRAGAGVAVIGAVLFVTRDSVWVSAMVLGAEVGLVGLLAADGLSVGQRRPWVRSAHSALEAAHDLAPWMAKTGSPLSAWSSGRLLSGLRSVAVGLFIVVVLASLLASGDAAFGWLLSGFDVASLTGHLVLITIMVLPVCVVALTAARARPDTGGQHRTSGRYQTEARAALWAVTATLGVWCGMQLVLAFGGADRVLSEQGITPAEYARQGFFQLVAVAAGSLVVLNGAHRLGRSGFDPDRGQRVPAIGIGAALSVLFVVTFGRLTFYIDAFGLTMLRASVATFLAWLALMTVLSVGRTIGVHVDKNWLPTAAVLSASIFAVGFGAADPEHRVAEANLARVGSSGDGVDGAESAGLDTDYLTQLSADAKPAVAGFDWAAYGGRPDHVTSWLCEARKSAGYGILGWNRARDLAADLDGVCPG